MHPCTCIAYCSTSPSLSFTWNFLNNSSSVSVSVILILTLTRNCSENHWTYPVARGGVFILIQYEYPLPLQQGMSNGSLLFLAPPSQSHSGHDWWPSSKEGEDPSNYRDYEYNLNLQQNVILKCNSLLNTVCI